MKRARYGWWLLIICYLLSGCATTPSAFKAHPQMPTILADANRIMVIPLKIELHQISAGGVPEKMDAWCGQARTNVMAAIQQELNKRPMLNIKTFNETLLSQDQRTNLDQTRALFEAVSISIVVHAYAGSGQTFTEISEDFDYSLGAEVSALASNVDAILFVQSYESIPTAGKKAVETGKVVLGLLTGVIMPVNVGFTHLSMALVDANKGTVIWYNQIGKSGSASLRNPIKTTAIIQELFKDFPM